MILIIRPIITWGMSNICIYEQFKLENCVTSNFDNIAYKTV